MARCQWLLGRLDTLAHAHVRAAQQLSAAASAFRKGHQLQDLVAVLIAQTDLSRRRRQWDDAHRLAEEAVRITSSRGMLLRQAEALVLRGRLLLDQAYTDPLPAAEALDDADAAYSLARRCGYVWAERDALQLRPTRSPRPATAMAPTRRGGRRRR